MNVTAPGSSRGFTLIEVVVALAIIVTVLAGLFFQVNRIADTSFDLRQRTLAQWVALNQLTLLRLNGVPAVGQKPSGTVEFANNRWRWQAAVIATDIRGFVEITVSVAPESAPKDTWSTTVEGFSGNAIAPPGTIPEAEWRPLPQQPAPGGGGGGTGPST